MTADRDDGRDVHLRCRDCQALFVFPVEDQRFFAEQNWPLPVRCKPCRASAKARREALDTRAVDPFADFDRRCRARRGGS